MQWSHSNFCHIGLLWRLSMTFILAAIIISIRRSPKTLITNNFILYQFHETRCHTLYAMEVWKNCKLSTCSPNWFCIESYESQCFFWICTILNFLAAIIISIRRWLKTLITNSFIFYQFHETRRHFICYGRIVKLSTCSPNWFCIESYESQCFFFFWICTILNFPC